MRLETLPLRDANLTQLAKISYDARHGTVLSNKARTIGEVEKRLNETVRSGKECVVIEAIDEEKETLCGFLLLFAIIPGIMQTGRWQPIVAASKRQGSIARTLIQSAKSCTRRTGRNRIEALFDEITPERRSSLRKYWGWYSREGFLKASEEFRMRSSIAESALEHDDIRHGFSLVQAGSVDKERIVKCYLRSFAKSMDRFILSMKPRQRRNTFDACYDPSSFLGQDASLCIERGDRVVAFVLVGTEKGESMIELIGVDPQFRRLGLGETILTECMRALLRKGTGQVDLEADVSNTPALKLYRKLRFVSQHRQAYYYLNL